MSENTQVQEALKRELKAKSLQEIKLEVVVPALHEITNRLEAREKDEKATQEEREKSKKKKWYWEAILRLVFAGYIQ